MCDRRDCKNAVFCVSAAAGVALKTSMLICCSRAEVSERKKSRERSPVNERSSVDSGCGDDGCVLFCVCVWRGGAGGGTGGEEDELEVDELEVEE